MSPEATPARARKGSTVARRLTVTSVMAAGIITLPGCDGDDDRGQLYADRDTAVCVDQDGRRVPDSRCGGGGGGGGSGFLWYYVGRASALPYYGDSVYSKRYQGSFKPRYGTAYALAPSSTRMTRSAAVSRGGLGTSGRAFGGRGG
jgi:uncharacterized protein YgiB involved in biofilm formation